MLCHCVCAPTHRSQQRNHKDAARIRRLPQQRLTWQQKLCGRQLAHRQRLRAGGLEKDELSRSEILEPYAAQRLAQSGAVLNVWITSIALMNAAGHMYAIATTERLRKA